MPSNQIADKDPARPIPVYLFHQLGHILLVIKNGNHQSRGVGIYTRNALSNS